MEMENTRISPIGSLVVRGFRVTWAAMENRWRLGKQPNK
jgi:hypothetical protein